MLDSDANLDRVPQVEGYKVLPPCVLYGKIGQGGMGAVYRGRHLNLDIDVAVKCLRPELLGDDEQFVVRFRREARSAARINHQNVVRVFDVSEELGLHYIVMELVHGETARQRVQRKQRLAIGEALEILWGAAQGLGEAHGKGFIHRDIKPDNLMISTGGQVKVADLGLAKPAGVGGMSMLSGTNVIMGTPQYMPPEQWENTATVTPAADVWALGAVLYYLLVGGEAIAKDSLPRIMQRIVMQPFPDVREQRPEVPADVAALIRKATAKAPEDRYADARELGDAIARLQTRRESLQDDAGVGAGEHNTLLSPPPAKTLAKIKFWLDEQVQRGPQTEAVAGRPSGPGADEPVGRSLGLRRSLYLLLAALLVIAAVFWWRPWQASELFAEADRLEQAGRFELAIAATQRVQTEQPGADGAAQRLARLQLAWARQLLKEERPLAALMQVDKGLGNSDDEAGQALRSDILAKVAIELEQALERVAPTTEPVPSGSPVGFRGRLNGDGVAELRIADTLVERAADGRFALALPLAGKAGVPVEVVLENGAVVALREWAVTYATPQPAAVERPRPPIVPTSTPSAAADRVAPENVPEGVQVTATSQSTSADAAAPAQPRPAPEPLTFAQLPTFVDARVLPDGRTVTSSDRVQVQGALSAKATRLSVNGQPLPQVTWQQLNFAADVTLSAMGENRLQLVAEADGEPVATAMLTIYRLAAPVLTVGENTKLRDEVASASYEVVVQADEWTSHVDVVVVDNPIRLRRDRGTLLHRGRVALAVGENVLVVRAVNVLEQTTEIELRIGRPAATARPELEQVQLLVDGELQPVRSGGQAFLREPVPMVLTASDPAAQVLLNGESIERLADGSCAIGNLLAEGRASAIEIVLENASGRCRSFKFFVWLDSSAPEAEFEPLRAPVTADQPFVLRGRWRDEGGLDVDRCRVGALEVELSPRGVAKQGSWTLRHPGLAAGATLELVLVDRAGNRSTTPLPIEVQ